MDSSNWRRVLGRALVLVLVVTLAGVLATGCQRGGEGAEGGDAEAENGESVEQDGEDGDGDGEEGENGEEEEEEAVPVQTTELERGRIESVLRFSTNLEAESQVQVLAESSREIEHPVAPKRCVCTKRNQKHIRQSLSRSTSISRYPTSAHPSTTRAHIQPKSRVNLDPAGSSFHPFVPLTRTATQRARGSVSREHARRSRGRHGHGYSVYSLVVVVVDVVGEFCGCARQYKPSLFLDNAYIIRPHCLYGLREKTN